MSKKATIDAKTRYRIDRSYRAKVRHDHAMHYRVTHDVKPKRPLMRKEDRRGKGKVRRVSLDGVSVIATTLSYTTREVASVIGGFTQACVIAWQRNGRMPYPMLHSLDDRKGTMVFSDAQVAAMLPVLQEHFREKNQIRNNDVVVTEALNAAMKNLT